MRYAQICHCTNASYGTRMILARFGWSMTMNLWSVGIYRAVGPANMSHRHRLMIKPLNRPCNNHRQISHNKRQPQPRNGYQPHSNSIRCKTGKIHKYQKQHISWQLFWRKNNANWANGVVQPNVLSWELNSHAEQKIKQVSFQFGDQRFEISHFISYKYEEKTNSRIQMVVFAPTK